MHWHAASRESLLDRIGRTIRRHARRAGKTIKHSQRRQRCRQDTVLCDTYPYVDLSVCQTSASRLQSETRWNTHREWFKFGHGLLFNRIQSQLSNVGQIRRISVLTFRWTRARFVRLILKSTAQLVIVEIYQFAIMLHMYILHSAIRWMYISVNHHQHAPLHLSTLCAGAIEYIQLTGSSTSTQHVEINALYALCTSTRDDCIHRSFVRIRTAEQID